MGTTCFIYLGTDTSYGTGIFWIKRHGNETGEYEAVTLVARSKSRCCTGNVSGRRND